MTLLFQSPEAFCASLEAWNEAQPSGHFDPHITPQWFRLLAKTAIPEKAKLALADAGGGSFLPLLCRPDQPGRLLGLSNFYSALFGLANEAAADTDVLQSLAAELMARRHGFYEARFTPMDPEQPSYALLQKAFSAAGWQVDDFFSFGNWYYPVGGKAYGEYLAERPSRLRNTIARAGKKLHNSGVFSLDIVEGGDALQSAIADFVVVYQRSWKTPEPFPNFIPALCELAARLGWLRLGVARYEGQAIAAQLWLVASGKAHIFKLAYDEDYAKFSAGTVLTAAMMRHVIDMDGVAEIDYLMGDDAYKQDWMSHRRERRGLIAFNPRLPRGLAAMAWHKGGKVWRSIQSRGLAGS